MRKDIKVVEDHWSVATASGSVRDRDAVAVWRGICAEVGDEILHKAWEVMNEKRH